MTNSYNMGKILKSRNNHALFFNTLDKEPRTKENKFFIGNELDKVKKYTEDVEYIFNSFGFRSDEFKKDHKGAHILFAGCSETEGAGGNLDALWAKMAYDEINKKQITSGFFNLGRSGWGWQVILANILVYIKEYGAPDAIFILFPNIGRFYSWKNSETSLEMFSHVGKAPNFSSNPSTKGSLTVEEQRNLFVSFSLSIKMLESLCSLNNIKLVWGTWDLYDELNFNSCEMFSNFIKMTDTKDYLESNFDFFTNEIKTRPDWENKRDGHEGYFKHFLWSKDFVNAFDKQVR